MAGGTPTLALNDGGTASYVSGSGSNALVFSYTVAAGQSTADLALAASNAISLNGATIRDTAGNSAVLTAATATTRPARCRSTAALPACRLGCGDRACQRQPDRPAPPSR